MDLAKVNVDVLRGKEVAPYFNSITELRMSAFKEYPYYYDESIAYEI